MPHPPFFYLISGFAMKIFGYNLSISRSLTAMYGVLTTILLFYLGTALVNKKLGLLTSFLFAIFPLAIVYNRWNLDYNLLQLLSVFTFLASINFLKTKQHKWFYAASIAAGVASITSFPGLGLVFGLFFLYFACRDARLVTKGVLLGFGVFAIYLSTVLSLQGAAFIFDLSKMVSSGGLDVSIFDSFRSLILYSPWIALGFIGLLAYPLFFRKKNESIITLGIFASFFLFTLELFPVQAPQIRGTIQLFPFFTLGIAFMIWGIIQTVMNPIQARWRVNLRKPREFKLAVILLWMCIFLVLAAPISTVVITDFHSALTRYTTDLDMFCAQSPGDAYAVANYINSHTDQNDFVIASPQVSWLFHCNHTDIEQAVAITHEPVIFYPTDMSNSRFVFNCTYQNAKYLVADDFSALFDVSAYKFILSNWTPVYNVGEYTVYLNPQHSQ
jgi:4-amino-4-deoxy-L-arabinose transferase-like glycosyltransferase